MGLLDSDAEALDIIIIAKQPQRGPHRSRQLKSRHERLATMVPRSHRHPRLIEKSPDIARMRPIEEKGYGAAALRRGPNTSHAREGAEQGIKLCKHGVLMPP